MNRSLAILLTGTALALAPATPLNALDTLSAGSLAAQCLANGDSGEAPGDACTAYVRGFVDGAVATDPKVSLNVVRELESAETFTERALRTRVGARIERFGPSVYADFCVPQPAPLWEITDFVIAELRSMEDPDEPAREVVYRALKANYPCV